MLSRQQASINKYSNKSKFSRKPKSTSRPFAPLPPSFRVALYQTQNDIRLSQIVPSNFGFGLYDWLGNVPSYQTALYTMYKFCKIHAVRVDVRVVSTGLEPLAIAIATVPFQDVPGISPSTLITRPGSYYTTIGGSAGNNIASFSRRYVSDKVLGRVPESPDFYQTSTQAAASTPNNVQSPVVVVSIDTANPSSTGSWVATYKITYEVEFFDREVST